MRLLIAALALFLLPAACAGGSETSSPTRSPAPTCTIDQLSGAFIRGGAAAGSSGLTYGITNIGPEACTLPGPPTLRLEDADGKDVGVTYTTNTICDTNQSDACVSGPLEVPPDNSTPFDRPGAPGQVDLLLLVANSANFDPPCNQVFPAIENLGLSFDGVNGELQLPWKGPIFLQKCYPQVNLYSFS